MRLFIAIDFPDEIIKEVSRVEEEISKLKFIGKVTELENLHLTLKFLGEVDEIKFEKIKKKLEEIKFEKIKARLDHLGTFSYNGNPRIVWSKISGEGIWKLQSEIDRVLDGLFNREERFMSHLTLARVKYVKDKVKFKDDINKLSIKKIEFEIGNFKLMKSELHPLGPNYECLGEYKLGQDRN
jgi:2'-5' RNA ligase